MSQQLLTHTRYLEHPETTTALGQLLGASASLPLVIGLDGDLGAGKTALCQGIGQGFGIAEHLTSPTFTLLNEYQGPRGALFHLDVYRLNSLDDLLELDLEAYLARQGLMLIEWFSQLGAWIEGPPLLQIALTHTPPGRTIHLTFPPACRDVYEKVSAWTP
ncbi:MAG: tRNA (adenosine(37)-N6)-threonylcarbamoyltransferase complex ATPase subunit type 1 TsaE [Candidatus Sericytochromatia bacterium]